MTWEQFKKLEADTSISEADKCKEIDYWYIRYYPDGDITASTYTRWKTTQDSIWKMMRYFFQVTDKFKTPEPYIVAGMKARNEQFEYFAIAKDKQDEITREG